MQRFQAVLFDFDGVLFESEPIHWQCWAEVVKPFGIQLDWNNFEKYCLGFPDRVMLPSLCALAPQPVTFEDLWAQYPRKRDLFLEKMLADLPITRESVSFIRSLKSYKLAVVSSGFRSEIEPVLEAAGLLGCFETVVAAGDAERSKPAPDPYLLAASRLGIRSALVVEDTDMGVESGRAAGFEVVKLKRARDLAREVRARLNGGGARPAANTGLGA